LKQLAQLIVGEVPLIEEAIEGARMAAKSDFVASR